MEQASEKQIGFAQKLGIENPSQYDKQALRGLIDVALKKQQPEEKVPVVRPGATYEVPLKRREMPREKNTTMYTSYAKDLMIGGKTREEAIADIKAIREAFS